MRKLSGWLGVQPENQGLLYTIYMAFFNSGMMTILLGAILPRLREAYGLNYVQSGVLLSTMQIGNFCAVLLVGILPYVLGRKKSTLLLGPGIVIGMVLMTVTGNMWLLIVAFALMGISRGTMSNICNSVVSDLADNRAAALNVLHATFAVGALMAPICMLALPYLLPWDWRCTPWVVALSALVVFIRIGFSPLSDKPTPKKENRATGFWKDLSFWTNAGILFFYLCAESAIIGWFVTYFRDTGRLPANVADFTPTLLWIMILAGRLICAYASARMDKAKLLLILGVVFTASFATLLLSHGTAACIACLLLIGLSMAGIYPTTLAATKNTSSTIVTGAIISIGSLGSILMPSIVGTVAEFKGLAGGVTAVVVALMFMVALMVFKSIAERTSNHSAIAQKE